MTATSLPTFSSLLERANGSLHAGTLSECHGMACGLLCRDPASNADRWLSLLIELQVEPGSDRAVLDGLRALFEATASQLADDDYGFELFLPGDDEGLEDRTRAMAQWCSGFLAALGASTAPWPDALSEEAREALGDLEQIARADSSDLHEDETEEQAFAEIVEYLRVVCLLIRAELRPAGPDDRLH